MRRRGASGDPDEPTEVGVEDDESPSAHRHRGPRRHRHGRRPSVKPWTIADLDSEEDDPSVVEKDEKASREGFWGFLRAPVFFRARDSWYFEPLVALAIIVVLLVSLFAYTGNWPPLYVVESGSMQHGASDQLGVINAGDLVLIKTIGVAAVVPYVVGEQTGYRTYGEFGDVLLYHPNGDAGVTPVIHRALLYLVWDGTTSSYSAPGLSGLSPCGSAPGALFSVSGPGNPCRSSNIVTTITLFHVGWANATVAIPVGALGHYSGFVTMGDNNFEPGPGPKQGEPDQIWAISGLVSGGWIVGAARGMLPWVGSFKLLVDGNSGAVPAQSWQFLTLTISAIVLAGLGLHYLFRVEGIEDPRRLAEEEAEAHEKADKDEEGPEWDEHPKGSRWRGLRAWLAASDESEEEPVHPRQHGKTHAHHSSRRPPRFSRGRGRPRPAVRKTKGFFHRRSGQGPSKRPDDESL